uniref:Uncharacterized protein LOC114331872 n=1 Tax=Diabrotica virgifera virgifera TaxID=50390 RepID=A0A6P7FRD9_DIAVI
MSHPRNQILLSTGLYEINRITRNLSPVEEIGFPTTPIISTSTGSVILTILILIVIIYVITRCRKYYKNKKVPDEIPLEERCPQNLESKIPPLFFLLRTEELDTWYESPDLAQSKPTPAADYSFHQVLFTGFILIV